MNDPQSDKPARPAAPAPPTIPGETTVQVLHRKYALTAAIRAMMDHIRREGGGTCRITIKGKTPDHGLSMLISGDMSDRELDGQSMLYAADII